MLVAQPSRSVLVIPLIVGLGIGGLVLARIIRPEPSSALPVYGQVPPFTLIDQRGRPFSDQTLRGSPWLADFIFTSCSGQCPMMSAQMAQLASSVPKTIRLVSFTVDPERDTPDVLARYAQTYHADARWSFVTGETQAIRRLCREGFKLSASDGQTVDEPVTHSTRLALVDRDGSIRGYYDAADEAAMRQLRRDLRRGRL